MHCHKFELKPYSLSIVKTIIRVLIYLTVLAELGTSSCVSSKNISSEYDDLYNSPSDKLVVLSNDTVETNGQEQLDRSLVNAKITKGAGALLTVTGTVLITAGLVKLGNSPTECDMINPWTTGRCHVTELQGGGTILAGFGLASVGMPLWVIGTIKKRHVKIGIAKYKSSASIFGIGLKIRF
jgi:hypothetical protein